MRVNITLACTECGERNYISKRTNATIRTALNLKNIAHVIKNLRYTVKQNKLFKTAEKAGAFNKVLAFLSFREV